MASRTDLGEPRGHPRHDETFWSGNVKTFAFRYENIVIRLTSNAVEGGSRKLPNSPARHPASDGR